MKKINTVLFSALVHILGGLYEASRSLFLEVFLAGLFCGSRFGLGGQGGRGRGRDCVGGLGCGAGRGGLVQFRRRAELLDGDGEQVRGHVGHHHVGAAGGHLRPPVGVPLAEAPRVLQGEERGVQGALEGQGLGALTCCRGVG